MSRNCGPSEVGSQVTLCGGDAHAEQVPTARCDMCHGMSAWDFLEGFYRKVDIARQYSTRLELDLDRASQPVQQTGDALAHYGQSLTIVSAALDQERLEHGATRRALDFEERKHMETAKLFDLAYEAATESGKLVETLRAKISELQEGSSQLPLRNVLTTAELLFEVQLNEDELRRLKTSLSAYNGQQYQIDGAGS